MSERTLSVLVADDDPFIRDMLADILSAGGYAVKTAENGADALKKYRPGGGAFDIVISDMNMPEMDGLGLLKELRRDGNDVPVIILTGNNEISVALDAIKSGANDYLLKDENIQDTVSLSVESVWEKHSLKKKNIELMHDLALKNEALEKSNQKLTELNQLKNKFLGIAAHDMRNPLTSIKGLSEIIINGLAGPVSAEQKECLLTVFTTADQMLTLVNDLLDVSVIESGRLELQLRMDSLKELIENRLKINRVVAERKKITIHADLADIPGLSFDRNRISQVFDNLVGNSIKFSPEGSNIHVTLKHEGNSAKVGVRDEGPGLSEDDKGKLFGEFQKLSARPTGGEKSTGLGLAIVKKIIEAHKGALEVQSAVGAGSTFSFTIPLGG